MKVATMLKYILCAAILVLEGAASAGKKATAEPCERKCGDVDVPYPFGIDVPSCAKVEASPEFLLKCNRSTGGSNSTAKLIVGKNIEVVGISLEDATISVRIYSSYKCYDESGPVPGRAFDQNIELGRSFTFSTAENKLVGLGCDTLAFMGDADGNFGSGCISLCGEDVDLAKEDACSGLGCCQTSVPKHVKTLNITLLSEADHVGILEFNPCDFALLVDLRTFNVSAMGLGFQPGDPAVEQASVLLDWVVGNGTCEDAKANRTSYACGPNTECSYSDNALGYRCNCAKGFRGNPYRNDLGVQGCLGTITKHHLLEKH